MKFVIQRCQEASVSVDGKTVGAIEKGLMVLDVTAYGKAGCGKLGKMV